MNLNLDDAEQAVLPQLLRDTLAHPHGFGSWGWLRRRGGFNRRLLGRL